MDIGVVVEHLDGTVFVRPTGELDLATAPELERVLEGVVAGRSGVVMVDLSGLTFVDCAGLRPIRSARRHTREVRVVGATPFVQRVLMIAGLDEPVAERNS